MTAEFDFDIIGRQADEYLAKLEARDPEIMASYRERRALVAPTFLQNWPQGLADISIPHAAIELTEAERRALIDAIWSREGEEPTDPAAVRTGLDSVKTRLQPLIEAFPEGAFVRLGSRSPKDSWIGMSEGFRVTNAGRALEILLDSMERIADDLSTDDYSGAPSFLYVRAWREIPAWAEFRCFMKGGRLAAIGQYDCQEEKIFPEIASNETAIREAIRIFFETKFRQACHLGNVVFDVYLTTTSDGLVATLLEINPFAPGLTYPGAFGWQEIMDWDGGEPLFRYLS